MANFNLDNFISQLNTSGIAKSNKFEVQITPPPALQNFGDDARVVSLYCDITNLPGMAITTKALKLYGAPYQRPISSEFNGEAINMSFYLDEKMNVRAFFDSWMFKIVNPSSFNVSYAKDYVTEIKISQLAPKVTGVNTITKEPIITDESSYSIYLEDAFPRAMSVVDFSSASVNQPGKLNVTFAYRRWFPVHRSYTGPQAKTNFNPLLKDPKEGVNTLIKPSNDSSTDYWSNDTNQTQMGDVYRSLGNGTNDGPYRLEIRGTNTPK
jgi:hypothetical protein